MTEMEERKARKKKITTNCEKEFKIVKKIKTGNTSSFCKAKVNWQETDTKTSGCLPNCENTRKDSVVSKLKAIKSNKDNKATNRLDDINSNICISNSNLLEENPTLLSIPDDYATDIDDVCDDNDEESHLLITSELDVDIKDEVIDDSVFTNSEQNSISESDRRSVSTLTSIDEVLDRSCDAVEAPIPTNRSVSITRTNSNSLHSIKTEPPDGEISKPEYLCNNLKYGVDIVTKKNSFTIAPIISTDDIKSKHACFTESDSLCSDTFKTDSSVASLMYEDSVSDKECFSGDNSSGDDDDAYRNLQYIKHVRKNIGLTKYKPACIFPVTKSNESKNNLSSTTCKAAESLRKIDNIHETEKNTVTVSKARSVRKRARVPELKQIAVNINPCLSLDKSKSPLNINTSSSDFIFPDSQKYVKFIATQNNFGDLAKLSSTNIRKQVKCNKTINNEVKHASIQNEETHSIKASDCSTINVSVPSTLSSASSLVQASTLSNRGKQSSLPRSLVPLAIAPKVTTPVTSCSTNCPAPKTTSVVQTKSILSPIPSTVPSYPKINIDLQNKNNKSSVFRCVLNNMSSSSSSSVKLKHADSKSDCTQSPATQTLKTFIFQPAAAQDGSKPPLLVIKAASISDVQNLLANNTHLLKQGLRATNLPITSNASPVTSLKTSLIAPSLQQKEGSSSNHLHESKQPVDEKLISTAEGTQNVYSHKTSESQRQPSNSCVTINNSKTSLKNVNYIDDLGGIESRCHEPVYDWKSDLKRMSHFYAKDASKKDMISVLPNINKTGKNHMNANRPCKKVETIYPPMKMAKVIINNEDIVSEEDGETIDVNKFYSKQKVKCNKQKSTPGLSSSMKAKPMPNTVVKSNMMYKARSGYSKIEVVTKGGSHDTVMKIPGGISVEYKVDSSGNSLVADSASVPASSKLLENSTTSLSLVNATSQSVLSIPSSVPIRAPDGSFEIVLSKGIGNKILEGSATNLTSVVNSVISSVVENNTSTAAESAMTSTAHDSNTRKVNSTYGIAHLNTEGLAKYKASLESRKKHYDSLNPKNRSRKLSVNRKRKVKPDSSVQPSTSELTSLSQSTELVKVEQNDRIKDNRVHTEVQSSNAEGSANNSSCKGNKKTKIKAAPDVSSMDEDTETVAPSIEIKEEPIFINESSVDSEVRDNYPYPDMMESTTSNPLVIDMDPIDVGSLVKEEPIDQEEVTVTTGIEQEDTAPTSNDDASIYLDYNATTPLDDAVVEIISKSLRDHWANPSSSYSLGARCKMAIKIARDRVAMMLNTRSDNIVFTSGGTESNNLAISSAIKHYHQWFAKNVTSEHKLYDELKTPHIITTNVEHDSVKNVLGIDDIEVTVVPWDMPPEEVITNVKPNTCLITIMLANNETGVMLPVRQIVKLMYENKTYERVKEGLFGVMVHTDASQCIGKITVDVEDLGVDYLTLTGHKFYGPRTGALFVKENSDNFLPLYPMLYGGGQERGLRPGTENTPMIVGLGLACRLVHDNLQVYISNMKKTKTHLIRCLKKHFGHFIKLNTIHQCYTDNPAKCAKTAPNLLSEPRTVFPQLPNTVSVAFYYKDIVATDIVEACPRVHFSRGSACHSDGGVAYEDSVLRHFGVCRFHAARTLRLSVGRYTTCEEVQAAALSLKVAVRRALDAKVATEDNNPLPGSSNGQTGAIRKITPGTNIGSYMFNRTVR